ncbi:MAG: hypothetical protein IBJ07_16845 [Rhizobiaceae bacterium]|nr:hypothetical protein [Rhizobiaceae bacterium]
MESEFWTPQLEEHGQRHGFNLTLHRSQEKSASFAVTRAHLQELVLARILVTSSCHPDGMIYPCPAGIEDEVLDVLFKENLLVGVPIDQLVAGSFELLMNEDADSATIQLLRLKERLALAITSVDDRLRGMELDRSATFGLA